MLKALGILVALFFVLLIGGAYSAQAIEFDGTPNYQITCTGINQLNPQARAAWTRSTQLNGSEILHYIVIDGDGTILYTTDVTVPGEGSVALPSFTYTTAPSSNPINFRLMSPAGGEYTTVETILNISDTCDALSGPAPVDPIKPVPGCSAMIPITSTSVVGSFVADALVYWQPGSTTSPLVTIPAGKTAWVLGQDSTEHYYKIVWACQTVWVEQSTMGPNSDKVWNGMPLPTGVVH